MELAPASVVRGLSMVQLAAVHAAVAEGFELEAVLDVEVLPPQAWFEAEVSWKARLVSDETVMARYGAELERQQDRLQRRVQPLEDDLVAWIAFLKFYQSHDDPFDLLAALELGFNDMARLGRHWSARFDADPKLAKRAAKLSAKLEQRVKQGDEVKPPTVTVKAAELTPSAAAGSYVDPAAVAAQDRGVPAASVPVLGLDQYAALSADLRVADERDRDAVLARYDIDTCDAVAIDEAWRCRLDSDRQLRADFRVLVGHYEQSARMRKRSAARIEDDNISEPVPATPMEAFFAPLPISAPAQSVRLPSAGTAPGVVMSHTAALPFAGRVGSMPAIVGRLPSRPLRRDGDVDGTADVIPALRDSEIMPFGTPAPVADASSDVDATMMLGAICFDDDEPLPFSGVTTPPPLSSESQPRPLLGGSMDTTGSIVVSLSDASLGSSVGPLDMTSGFVVPISDDGAVVLDDAMDATTAFRPLDIEVDIEDDLPPVGQPNRSPAPKPADMTVTATMPARDPLGVAETAEMAVIDDPSTDHDVDSTAVLRVLDLGLDDEREPTPAADPTSAPPSLSLDQLASLHAELAVRPHDAAAIRARHRLPNHEAQQHQEAYWQQRFATHPQEQAAYYQRFKQVRAWLLSQGS